MQINILIKLLLRLNFSSLILSAVFVGNDMKPKRTEKRRSSVQRVLLGRRRLVKACVVIGAKQKMSGADQGALAGKTPTILQGHRNCRKLIRIDVEPAMHQWPGVSCLSLDESPSNGVRSARLMGQITGKRREPYPCAQLEPDRPMMSRKITVTCAPELGTDFGRWEAREGGPRFRSCNHEVGCEAQPEATAAPLSLR
jgi:hypothetical protein